MHDSEPAPDALRLVPCPARTRSPRPQVHRNEATLEPGKCADAVIARGNPLDDIRALGDPANILLVMRDGVAYEDVEGLAARAGAEPPRPTAL